VSRPGPGEHDVGDGFHDQLLSGLPGRSRAPCSRAIRACPSSCTSVDTLALTARASSMAIRRPRWSQSPSTRVGAKLVVCANRVRCARGGSAYAVFRRGLGPRRPQRSARSRAATLTRHRPQVIAQPAGRCRGWSTNEPVRFRPGIRPCATYGAPRAVPSACGRAGSCSTGRRTGQAPSLCRRGRRSRSRARTQSSSGPRASHP
jgi:hypothetical protein